MHCYDVPGEGDLPPIVLLHGLATAATPFGPLMARLRPHTRRVLAPDQLGHGFSAGQREILTPKSLLDATVQTLDPLLTEPAIVVGNSLGGAVAVRYALARPSRVRALILVSPAGARAEEHEWRELKQVFDMSSRADAAGFFRRVYHAPPWFLALIAHELPAAMARVPVRSLLRDASNDTALEPAELEALRVPVLLVWGQGERLLPLSHLAYFQQHLPPGSRIERPASFGHSPHIDAPAALAELIVKYGRSIGLSGASATGTAQPPSLDHGPPGAWTGA